MKRFTAAKLIKRMEECMRNKTKLLCVALLVTLLVSMLASCGGNDQPSVTPAESTSPSETTPSETPSEVTPGDDVGVKFPLVDEPATLTVWRPWINTLVTDANDLVCNQLIEQKTNVHIEWTLVSVFSMAQDFNLMIATGDYPDIVQDYGMYAGGFDAAVLDGIYMDAAPYLHIAPTFTAFRESNENIRKLTTTDSGIVYFGGIQSGEQPAWGGPMMRIDWLEDLGLSSPRTYDDWHEILVAFKGQLGIDSPLWLATSSVDQGMGLIGGYGVNYTFYNENGTVKFGPMEEGYREYLAMLADWYDKGLIYKDWAGAQQGDDGGAIARGDVGATTFAAYTSREIARISSEDPAFKWESVRFPSKDGSPTKFRMVNAIAGGAGKFITSSAVERGVDALAARWIDALYTEELSFIQNYGEEGVHWELGDDGLPHFTDEVLNNPDYQPNEMISLISDMFNTSYYMWVRENDMYEPETVEGCDRWMESGTGEWVIPHVTLTVEESETYSRYLGDIQTYVDEFTTKVINGVMELNDTTWNEYVSWLKASGIEECMAIYQSALARYLAR